MSNEIHSAVRMTATFTPKVPLPQGLLEALDDSGILADIAAAFGAVVELQVRAARSDYNSNEVPR